MLMEPVRVLNLEVPLCSFTVGKLSLRTRPIGELSSSTDLM